MLPSTQDYKIALMIGADSFRTLENVEVVMNPLYPDEPWYSTGGLAIVFKIKMGDTTYALKCFHKKSPERQYRLQRIAEYIKQNPSPFWVEFEYLDNELWVESNGEGQGYPVVLMEWIEGKTLDNHLEELCSYEGDTPPPRNKRALKNLYFHFCSLTEWLLFTPVAHGDLKHDNIIVLPSGHLKLIDYDGMYIPEFEGREATELGSPCYQHPERTKTYFNDRLDEFSMLVILTTLYAVYDDPEIFRKHYNGDGILFSDSDLRDCYESELLKSLLRSKDQHLELLSKLLCRFQSISTLVQLKEIFDNEDWSEWKKRQAEIRYNEEIILQELLWKFKGWAEYEMILYLKDKSLFFDRLPGKLILHCYGVSNLSKNSKFIWSEDWIEAYEEFWNWGLLSSNQKLHWKENLILKYDKKWHWNLLSANEGIPWTSEFIEKYSEKFDWKKLSWNESIPWIDSLIEKYEDKWDWQGLSFNRSLRLTEHLIDKYLNKWDWWYLSRKRNLEWTNYFIEKYEDKLDWRGVSENESICWNHFLLKKYKDKLDWNVISFYSPLFKNIESIEYYGENINWSLLSGNKYVTWDVNMIKKYEKGINWEALSKNIYILWSNELIEMFKDNWSWSTLSYNTSLPWTNFLIEKYLDKWNWRGISINKSIPWSESLLEKYKEKWDWGELGISFFSEMDLSNKLIEKYKDKWCWGCFGLSENNLIPWSLKTLEYYKDRWDWKELSKNKSLPWSKELIFCFKDKWDWNALSSNQYIPWTEELIDFFGSYMKRDVLRKNESIS